MIVQLAQTRLFSEALMSVVSNMIDNRPKETDNYYRLRWKNNQKLKRKSMPKQKKRSFQKLFHKTLLLVTPPRINRHNFQSKALVNKNRSAKLQKLKLGKKTQSGIPPITYKKIPHRKIPVILHRNGINIYGAKIGSRLAPNSPSKKLNKGGKQTILEKVAKYKLGFLNHMIKDIRKDIAKEDRMRKQTKKHIKKSTNSLKDLDSLDENLKKRSFAYMKRMKNIAKAIKSTKTAINELSKSVKENHNREVALSEAITKANIESYKRKSAQKGKDIKDIDRGDINNFLELEQRAKSEKTLDMMLNQRSVPNEYIPSPEEFGDYLEDKMSGKDNNNSHTIHKSRKPQVKGEKVRLSLMSG